MAEARVPYVLFLYPINENVVKKHIWISGRCHKNIQLLDCLTKIVHRYRKGRGARSKEEKK